ncbi:MAG: GtrA family protein, partial [Betaproteobacteria bacterium]
MKETANQAVRYLIGAVIALVLDTAAMLILITWGVPTLLARAIALLIGITTTYVFNRAFTFEINHSASFVDWFRYVAAQSVGSALNFLASTVAISFLGRSTWAVVVSAARKCSTVSIAMLCKLGERSKSLLHENRRPLCTWIVPVVFMRG